MAHAIEVRRLSGALGARMSGVDFAAGLDQPVLAAIEAALVEHQVLAIDATAMRPDQQVEIARFLGEPEHHDFFPNLGPGLEHVTVLDSAVGERADRWHIDETFLAAPPAITTLHARILPSYGGDTAFVSMAAAYDALSSRMRDYIDGLTAIFDFSKIAELLWLQGAGADKMAKFNAQPRFAEHAIVKVHPVSGRRSIYAESMYLRHIVGLPELEGKTLIAFLAEHAQRPEFGYRHTWQAGDLLLWDNRSVMHYAVADFAERRCMHRVSVMTRATALEAAA